MLDSASIGAFLNVTDGDIDRLQQDMDALRALDLDHIEVWMEHQPTSREFGELARLLHGWVTIMHGPFIGMSLSTDWDDLAGISLERCHRAIEAAGALGCRVVTLHAGAYEAFSPENVAIDRLARRISRFTKLAQPMIAIENMPARGGATREAVAVDADLELLVGRLPELAITFDVGHSLQNGEDPIEMIRRHESRIANVHLHDGTAGGSAHHALGGGELVVDEFVAALDQSGYKGFVSIETLSIEDLASSLATLAELDVRPGRISRMPAGLPHAA